MWPIYSTSVKIKGISISPEISLISVWSLFLLSSSSPTPGNHCSDFRVRFLELYEWNHIFCTLLSLVSLMQHNICDIHVVFPSYFLLKSALLYECAPICWSVHLSLASVEVVNYCITTRSRRNLFKKKTTKLSEPLNLFIRQISRMGSICRRQISRMGSYEIERFTGSWYILLNEVPDGLPQDTALPTVYESPRLIILSMAFLTKMLWQEIVLFLNLFKCAKLEFVI